MSNMPSSLGAPGQPALKTGLAIASLITGILGFCLPGVGLIAIVLGAIALMKASSNPETHGGKGLAIGGIIAGFLSILAVIALTLILMPALGVAREQARDLVTQTHLRIVGSALQSYAAANKDWYPESIGDWQSRLTSNGISPELLHSPRAPKGATDAFIYVPGLQTTSPSQRILAYENPAYVVKGTVAVLYVDGRVERMDVAELNRVLGTAGRLPASGGDDTSHATPPPKKP